MRILTLLIENQPQAQLFKINEVEWNDYIVPQLVNRDVKFLEIEGKPGLAETRVDKALIYFSGIAHYLVNKDKITYIAFADLGEKVTIVDETL